MSFEEFEIQLRESLARIAGDVPDEAVAHLRTAHYPVRGRRAPVITALATMLIVAAAVATALSQHSGASVRRAPAAVISIAPTASPRSGVTKSGPSIQLAGFDFRLPAGYALRANPCVTTPALLGPTVPLIGATSAAAAPGGSCVVGALVSATGALPAGAVAVSVGSRQGYVVDTPDVVTLLVVIRVSGGTRALALSANKLSPEQLIAIATASLPPDTATPPEKCSASCG